VDVVAPRPAVRAKYVVRSTTIGLSAVTCSETFVSGVTGLTSMVTREVGPTLNLRGGGASPSCGRNSTCTFTACAWGLTTASCSSYELAVDPSGKNHSVAG